MLSRFTSANLFRTRFLGSCLRTAVSKSQSETSAAISQPPKLPSIKELNKQLLKTLTDTLKDEACAEQLINIDNFTLTREGTLIKLVRRIENEIITVEFDARDIHRIPTTTDEINEEINDDYDFESVPKLKITVNKDHAQKIENKGAIVFNLTIASDDFDDFIEDYDEDDFEEDYEETRERPMKFDEDRVTAWNLDNGIIAEIAEISYFDENGKQVYKLGNEMAEEDFLTNMVTFLRIRGVDTDFLKSVVKLSSQIDNQMYVEYLNGLKKYFS